MDGVCGLYEKELKALNPNQQNITYDIADLYAYVDQLADISCLVCVAMACHSWARGKCTSHATAGAVTGPILASQVPRSNPGLLATQQ